jgi:hypothetical protein
MISVRGVFIAFVFVGRSLTETAPRVNEERWTQQIAPWMQTPSGTGETSLKVNN